MSDYLNLNEITTCEVCGNTELISVLNLGLHPMCDDLVPINNDWICKEYPINIVYCKNCFTAHQKFQIPKAELFPRTYHYRARFTSDVLNGMKSLVDRALEFCQSLNNKIVLDIGCNDGSLLNFFREHGAKTFGIEPTDAYKDAEKNNHKIINSFFSVDAAQEYLKLGTKPDVISFTNVFAHIEDLGAVIEALKVLIDDQTIIVIENHYLGAILEKNQFDTFYHEHPRTYSYKSFTVIAKSLGLELLGVDFPSRYGGNIRVIMGKKDFHSLHNFNATSLIERESYFYDQFGVMREKIDSWKLDMKDRIKELVKTNGKLKAKGFPGRAAILVKLLELNLNSIEAVYEKQGSMKIGNFLPGTRIPIKSDDELFKTLPHEKVILNLAWHINTEISQYLKNNGFKGQVLNIL